MGQRSMQSFNQNDLGIDQRSQGRPYPDQGFIFGRVPNVSQGSVLSILSGSGSMPDAHHLREHNDNAIHHGAMQYSCHPQHLPSANIDVGVGTRSNIYSPYTNVPIHPNQGFPDQFLSSSNQGVMGFFTATDQYGRNNIFMKRKSAEGFSNNFQYFDVSASSSSANAGFNAMQFESGIQMVDAAPFPLPQFSDVGVSSNMEVDARRSIRNCSATGGLEPLLAHNQDHLVPVNYQRPPFQPVGTPWLDQQPSSSGGDGGTSTWNRVAALPYFRGGVVIRETLEGGNQGIREVFERTHAGASANFLQPPLFYHQRHSLYNSELHVNRLRSHNLEFRHAHGLAANSARTSVSPQDGADAALSYSQPLRYSQPTPQNSDGLPRPLLMRGLPESALRMHNSPYLRYLPDDEVAILEFAGSNEAEYFVDQHRDMRLDVDVMSYEELLELEEQIGNVKTGLSEEAILGSLSIRTFSSSATCADMEETADVDEREDLCVICQDDYKSDEKIGILDCGHEYHADCLKKWLLIKNICPICKSLALNDEREES